MRTVEQIPCTHIDAHDATFLITFQPDLEPLMASLKLAGQLEPVILREKTDKMYQIVCGFKRVEALHLLAIDMVAAFVYRQGELDDLQALQLTIGHNITHCLNLVEKAQALQKLLDFGVSEREVIDHYLPLFALQPHMSMLKQVIDLLTLEKGMREYLVHEELSLSAAASLLDLDQKDQKVILPLLLALRPGENRIKEIVSFLREISLRDNVPISSLLTRNDIIEILTDSQAPRQQRLEHVRRIIKEMRFPLLTAMEQRFTAYKRSLALPPQISFHHPPFFEGEEFRMELRFKDFKAFRELAANLGRIADAAQGDADPLADMSRGR
jgi:hypothetical protein